MVLMVILNIIKVLALIITARLAVLGLEDKASGKNKSKRHSVETPKLQKTRKRRLIYGSLTVGVCAVFFDSYMQLEKDKRSEQSLSLATNSVVNLQNKFQSEIGKLTQIFSTNVSIPSEYRNAMFDKALSDVSNFQVSASSELHSVDLSSPNLDVIRKKRVNEIAIREAKKAEEAIILEREKMRGEDQLREQKAQEMTNAMIQAWADKNLLEFERIQTKQIFLPLFDKVIAGLDKLVSNASGWKSSHDFAGSKPSAYSANFITSDGRLQNGTNVISFGTNGAWVFKVKVNTRNLRAKPGFSPWTMPGYVGEIRVIPANTYATIQIESGHTNGSAFLSISPRNRKVMLDSSPLRVDAFTANYYSEVEVRLNVPNGLNMEKTASISEFTNVLSDALVTLVGALDEQVPLPNPSKL